MHTSAFNQYIHHYEAIHPSHAHAKHTGQNLYTVILQWYMDIHAMISK